MPPSQRLQICPGITSCFIAEDKGLLEHAGRAEFVEPSERIRTSSHLPYAPRRFEPL